MKYSIVLVASSLLAGSTLAHPMRRSADAVPTKPVTDNPSDPDVLNFALTLEHLENNFYTGGLAKFTPEDFVNAGLPPWVYGRVQQISAHEAEHVEFLTEILGDQAVKPCEYSFPYDDPKSFLHISHALETVGTSAYEGAAKFIQNRDYLMAAATILGVEARHSSWLDSAVRKGAAWSTSFDTPLDLNQVFSIAAAFITSCPPDNTPLPVKAFAPLALVDPNSAAPGNTVTIQWTAPEGYDKSQQLYATFLTGHEALIVPVNDDGTVQIPDDLIGTVYMLITTNGEGVDDETTLAGPLMLEFPFNSLGQLITLPF
ncbi:hypothetical protein EWM64_g6526 [Hericium alpestre]|uniref:Uncharacterized protein n=1 Tax=Hericium alpestre TaxID=135208 RepID=A0A4Y9ZTW3_9AGAM|nr:hypothetical protein EWM64_g6526 [Hericium alpestre]